jgi:hypothetical protein
MGAVVLGRSRAVRRHCALSGRNQVRAPLIGHHDLRLLARAAIRSNGASTEDPLTTPPALETGVAWVLDNCTRRLGTREDDCDVKMLDF